MSPHRPPRNSVCTLGAPQTVHACSGPFTLQTVLHTQGHPPPQTVHTRPEPPNHACTLRAPQTMHIHSRPPKWCMHTQGPHIVHINQGFPNHAHIKSPPNCAHTLRASHQAPTGHLQLCPVVGEKRGGCGSKLGEN